MPLREQDKHFLSSLYSAAAVIFVWKGLWEGLYEIPYLGDAFVALFIGFTMLVFSGLIFKEFDPLGGLEQAITKKMEVVISSSEKKNFEVKYHDSVLKKDLTIPAKYVHRIEEAGMVVVDPVKKNELFIPLHRVTEILYNGKRYWRF
ncbi:DUF504 domain-containing protein [Candidatus Woesearchaeota archaeon]|nr:DUF504 domain-containing protein [Candidatus Woesearchaeota archaeon]